MIVQPWDTKQVRRRVRFMVGFRARVRARVRTRVRVRVRVRYNPHTPSVCLTHAHTRTDPDPTQHEVIHAHTYPHSRISAHP